ncbi:MAG: T9SS type A sorting domain-containing protein [Ignavibacteriales bacterium]|nr:T9SS type A sorting domain-containing protein [Ignavibacteriales bacterium]
MPLTNQHVQDIYKATTTAPNLLSPGNDSTLINPISITLDWDSTVTANLYQLIIASDSLFNTVIKDTITNTSSVNLEYDFFIYYDNQYWKVRTINDGGTGPWSEVNHFSFLFTDVEDETQLPTEFALLQNYPNPFNPTTTITYHLPKTANVELKVYDVLGNEVATLINEEKSAGVFEVQFNVTQDSRPAMSSGVYFYKLTAGDFASTKKMILIK